MARSDLLRTGAADRVISPLPTLVSAIGHMRKMEGIALVSRYITGPFTPRISMPLRTNSLCHQSCMVNRKARHPPRRHTDAMGMARRAGHRLSVLSHLLVPLVPLGMVVVRVVADHHSLP